MSMFKNKIKKTCKNASKIFKVMDENKGTGL